VSTADKFSILLASLALIIGLLGSMLRVLWRLAATLTSLTVRLEQLEEAQDNAVTIKTHRRPRKPR
jgi:TRAP-type C4-dicarboxylate transport system permease small subunit